MPSPSTQVAPRTKAPAVRLFCREYWLVGPRFDLAVFSLSTLVTPILVLGYMALCSWYQMDPLVAGLWVYVVFTGILDAPHILQTFARTHFDASEFQRRKWLHLLGAPVCMALIVVAFTQGGEAYFYLGFQFFGAYHILRQNIGFLHLYQRREARDAVSQRLEIWLLYGVWLYGLIYLPAKFDYSAEADNLLNIWFLEVHHGQPLVYRWVQGLLGWGSITIGALWCSRQIWCRHYNGPKIIYLCSILVTYCVTFIWLRDYVFVTALALVAFETAYHDLQYHGFMSYYQKRRFGLRSWVSRYWLRVCLGYGIFAIGIEWGLVDVAGFSQLWLAPVLGLVVWHYYIDGKIWRGSQAPELRCLFATNIGQEKPLKGNAA